MVSTGVYSDDLTDPDSTYIPTVALSSASAQTTVVGTVTGHEDSTTNRKARIGNIEFGRTKSSTDVRVLVKCNGLGPIAVCNEGGDIVAGDLLCTSTIQGVACKQANQTTVDASTCAKATGCVAFVGTEVVVVGCLYKF